MMRSAAYRIATIYSAAFVVATLVLGVAVYYAAHVALQTQLDDRIAAEMSSLVSEYRGEGLTSLKLVISRRELARATNDLGYALYDPAGHRVAGTLSARRPALGWSTIGFVDREDASDVARSFAVRLDGGERLAVAADWDELEAADRLILTILGVAFLVELIIGGIGAVLLGAYLRHRLSAISGAAEGIIAGDLSTRARVGPRGDEFDRLSAALNAMLDRIGELLDTLRQVSSDVAHDLRTPLSRLRNGLEEGLRTDPGPAVIERAIEQSDQVLSLFSAILRLSEIEAGGLRRAFAPVDLAALVRDLAESYAPAMEAAGRTLAAHVETVPPVIGDRELLAQAVINLLDNALAHTPVGTTVRLGLAAGPGGAMLTVADDGPGIPEADRDRVVQRFARLEASRTRPGYGLGLSLVAAVARIHATALVLGDARPGLVATLTFGAARR